MITFLKRRFSSGDLQGELADKREQEGFPSFIRFGSTTATSGQSNQPSQTHQTNSIQQQQQQHPYRHQDSQSTYGGSASSQTYPQTTNAQERSQARAADEATVGVRKGHGTYPSAPTSPTRNYGGSGAFMGPMGSITGQISSTIMRGFSSAASTAQNITSGKITSTKERYKVLLVIDDSQTDW
ncbi:hypothetical protein P879_09027 [Paragonimus westermani]|uniref:Synapsin n=1 Tax=Paragonimus westermani TaxID=34504 RepID=A0A8T0DFK9_9TREM|nr:hypothetical protein P879_09027 [Paragonimus westermani]